MVAPNSQLHVRFVPNRYREVAARRTVVVSHNPTFAHLFDQIVGALQQIQRHVDQAPRRMRLT
jgi:hypothetical protein